MWWGVGYLRPGQGWVEADWGPCKMTPWRGGCLSDCPSKDSEPLQVRVLDSTPGRGQLMVGGVCCAVGASPWSR